MTHEGGLGAIWRRISRNTSIIVGERVVFGLLNLASAAVAVRAVGIEGFGVVVLLQAYVRLIGGLIKFQSWAALARYGAGALESGDRESFRRLIGFTARLDIVGFALAVGLAALAAPLAAPLLNWSPEVAGMAPWFALTIPFIVNATPTGVLRLFDRFAVLAQQHAINAVLRFLGVAAVLWLDAGVGGLVLAWAAASVVSGLRVWTCAAGEILRRRLTPILWGRWSTLSRGFDNIWRFVLVLNANSVLETLMNHMTTLVVGAMLGPAATGLFGIVRQITEPLRRFSSLLGPIVFPEFAWLAARGDSGAVARLLARTLIYCAIGLGGLYICLYFGAEILLRTLFDPEAAAAAALLTAVAAAAALVAVGFAMEPVMLTTGRDRALLATSVVSVVIFAALLLPFIDWFGLIGAGYALLARQAILFLSRLAILHRALADRPA